MRVSQDNKVILYLSWPKREKKGLVAGMGMFLVSQVILYLLWQTKFPLVWMRL